MNVVIAQVYVRAGVSLPFSHVMQGWLAHQVSDLARSDTTFVNKYGDDYTLVLYVSASAGTSQTQIKGPGVYRKSREVEYSIFLPFDVIASAEPEGCRCAAELLLIGIADVLVRLGVDASGLREKMAEIVQRVCSDPNMVRGHWPRR